MLNFISKAQAPVPDDIYNYDSNNEGLDSSVQGAKIFPENGEFKKDWIYSDVYDSEIN